MSKKQSNNSKKVSNHQKPRENNSLIQPDTGKRGVQPLGTVKPYPPRPTPPIVHVQKDS